MLKLTLERRAYLDRCTLGMLRWPGTLRYTLEPEWRGNLFAGSCIPVGSFAAGWYDNPKLGRVLLLRDVPQREGIEIHIGNTRKDTHGCILLGSGYGWVNEQFAVVGSGMAVRDFAEQLSDESEFVVEVINYVGGVLVAPPAAT